MHRLGAEKPPLGRILVSGWLGSIRITDTSAWNFWMVEAIRLALTRTAPLPTGMFGYAVLANGQSRGLRVPTGLGTVNASAVAGVAEACGVTPRVWVPTPAATFTAGVDTVASAAPSRVTA